jgi:hypothetical protein
MRNRAKCKLCEEIIESTHRHDYVTCKCGEISVDGGDDYHRCRAGNWENFLRVDDEGNIVIPVIKDPEPVPESPKPTKDELLSMLTEMIKRIESLPPQALYSPVNHADLNSLLILLASIFRAD